MGDEPPHVFGITEADFQSWKHNPVTKMFVRYLGDYAEALERDHLLRWKTGALNEKIEYEAAGRQASLTELAVLEFSHVYAFYEEPEQQETDEDTTV